MSTACLLQVLLAHLELYSSRQAKKMSIVTYNVALHHLQCALTSGRSCPARATGWAVPLYDCPDVVWTMDSFPAAVNGTLQLQAAT